MDGLNDIDLDSIDDDIIDEEDTEAFIDADDLLKDEDDETDKDQTEHDEEIDDSSDYIGGTPVNSDELLKDDHDEQDEMLTPTDNEFISVSGDFVVMDNNGDVENAFELKIVDINDIAITKRVRQNANADDITRSIKSTGLLMPVVVAPTATEGMYVLLDGWRRLMGCCRAGKRKIPVLVNNNVNTPEIPILESMYNHAKKYSIKEIVDYIDYLEKEKGIMNPSMIEYLLQLNSGDYTKLKDILNDNDEDIVEKLFSGVWDIDTAFKKLEQRRKKESAEEKENKKAAAVYDDEEKSGIDQIAGAGEEAEGEALSEDQINEIMINPSELDSSIQDENLKDMVEQSNNIEGFKPHKQKVGEREYIDPAIKKATMIRDKGICQCCKHGGEQFADILDYHHILPVFLGGTDTIENGIMLCVSCHRLVHLYSTGDLNIDNALFESTFEDLPDDKKEIYKNEQVFEDEKDRFKRIVRLGDSIRRGMAAKGINREQFKKEHSNAGIGRRKPGVGDNQEKS